MRTRSAFCFLVLYSFLTSLPARAAVRGTLMDRDGKPLGGLTVAAYVLETTDARFDRFQSGKERTPTATAISEANGRFVIETRKDAVWEVIVQSPSYVPTQIAAVGDDDLGAIRLEAAPARQGIVRAGGKPVEGVTVVWSSPQGSWHMSRTDGEGRYSVPDPDLWASGVMLLHPQFARSQMDRASKRQSLDYSMDPGVALTGNVVSENGKSPVAKAQVSVDGWLAGESAEDGSFSIAHAPARWRELSAVSGDRIGLRTRGEGKSYQVRLQRGSSLSGTVVDSKSKRPLAGTLVRILPADTASRVLLRANSSFITDAKGTFSFRALPQGNWELRASHRAYSIANTRVSSKASAPVTSTITATARPILTGVVLDESKKPVAAVSLTPRITSEESFIPMPFRPGALGYSGPDGRFVVRPSDFDQTFELVAQRKGLPNGTSGSLKLAAGERKSDITIVIPSGISVTGQITDAKGSAISGVEVVATESAADRGQGIRTVIMSRTGSNTGEDNVRSDAKGKFEMKLKPGTYDLDFSRDGYAARRVSSQVVEKDPLPISVVLDAGVEIQGRLVRSDGSGVPDARIQLVSLTVGRPAEPVITAGDGSFTISNLQPGQVRVLAIKPEEMINEMRVVSAPSTDLLIELTPGGKISATVVDKSTKQPILDFDAGAQPGGGGQIRMRTQSSKRPFHTDDGRFVLENIPVGQADLRVSAPGYVEARFPAVKVEEGKVTQIEVQLETGVRLVGKVSDSSGSPLASVSVGQDTSEDSMMRGMGIRSPSNSHVMTDENGDYSVDSLEPSEKNFTFRKPGFITDIKSVKLSGKETRLDVKLSKGKTVTGMVVTESGAPVEGASVSARSALQNANRTSARSDGSGTFQLEGLAPGRYTFSASKAGFVSGELPDVDVESGAGQIRIRLSSGGVIYGRVQGLKPSELSTASVMAGGSGGGGLASARVDASGEFRIPAVAPGNVRVFASTNDQSGSRTSKSKNITVEAGGQVQVDLEFDQSTSIRGRVTREGKAVAEALVTFAPTSARTETRSSGLTDSGGSYEITGLEDGPYDVRVFYMSRRSVFQTSHTVNGSGTFDIEIKSTAVRGTVVDSKSGEPIAEAVITLQKPDARGGVGPGAVTDAAGVFELDGVSEGTYRVRAQKSGYGQQLLDLAVTSSPGQELQFKLEQTPGVKLKIVDARDGRALSGMIVVRDAREARAFEGPAMPDAAGIATIPLAPGSYTATVSAIGYASQRIPVTSPSPEIRVALTPGGTIIIKSGGSETERGRLLDAGGQPLFSELRIGPGVTTLDHVAPGNYTIVILDAAGAVRKRLPVVVSEGGTSSVDV